MIAAAKDLLLRAASALGVRPPATDAPAVTTSSIAATTTATTTRRRRKPWEPSSWYGRAFCWLLSPILDPHDNYPSGPRCMAWYIATIAVKHEIGAALAGMLLATMWGYSAWKANQEKTTATLSAVQNITGSYAHSDTKTETKAEHVERRYVEEHYTAEGVPAISLPPRDGATTPAGEA